MDEEDAEAPEAVVGFRERGGWEKDFDFRIDFGPGVGSDSLGAIASTAEGLSGGGGKPGIRDTTPFRAREDNASVLERVLNVRFFLSSPGMSSSSNGVQRKLRLRRLFHTCISGICMIINGTIHQRHGIINMDP